MNKITLALFAFNQEKFIEEAVLGALSQDYKNLEVIISDDCSSDNTYEIIRRTISDYSGPHKVILNRNAKNLGLCNHINKVFDLSSGDLIVMAAGDDISLPQRVSTLVSAWVSHGSPDGLIFSDAINIDENGNEINTYSTDTKIPSVCEYLITFVHFIHGATVAYSKSIVENFEPLPSDCFSEDRILSFRSLLSGRAYKVNSALVKYRKNSSSLSNINRNNFEYAIKFCNECMRIISQHARDSKNFSTLHAKCDVNYHLNNKMRQFEKYKKILEKGGFISRLVAPFFFPIKTSFYIKINTILYNFHMGNSILYKFLHSIYFKFSEFR